MEFNKATQRSNMKKLEVTLEITNVRNMRQRVFKAVVEIESWQDNEFDGGAAADELSGRDSSKERYFVAEVVEL